MNMHIAHGSLKRVSCVIVVLCTLLTIAAITIAATKPLLPPGTMIVTPLYDPLSASNKGLIAWWLYYPKVSGAGVVWRNLVDPYHMTLTNMAGPATATSGWSPVTLRKGGFGEVRFDGVNDYALVTTGTSNKYAFVNSKGAIELWFSTPTTAAQQYIISNQSVSSAQGGWVIRIESSGLIRAKILDPTNSTSMQRDTVSTITTTIWHHLVVNFTTDTVTQANNEIGIILDGVQDQSSRTDAALPYGPCGCDVRIGIFADNTSSPFSGKVDSVRVYNRLLSITEARQHRASDMMYASMQLNQISEITQAKLMAPGGGTNKGNFMHWFMQ